MFFFVWGLFWGLNFGGLGWGGYLGWGGGGGGGGAGGRQMNKAPGAPRGGGGPPGGGGGGGAGAGGARGGPAPGGGGDDKSGPRFGAVRYSDVAAHVWTRACFDLWALPPDGQTLVFLDIGLMDH
ncbi:MAG: hypothetical protein IPK98_14515 [Chloracidobacterium sp.]|nr:hypothetical protein [Chloracidobacterium sp.]